MAFATDTNFLQRWSAETTVAFLRNLTIGRRVNRAWDADVQMAEKVSVQNPNYNVVPSAPARKAVWGTPNEPSASKIDIDMDQIARVENMLYVEDQVENVVRDYRSRLQTVSMSNIAKAYEDNVVAYMLALTASSKAADNGNAGGITEIAQAGGNSVGFTPGTGKPFGTAAQQAQAQQWIIDFLTDSKVMLNRADVPQQDAAGSVIGGNAGGAFWCYMPVELYAYGLAPWLENKGLSLDFTSQVIQNVGVFGSAFAGNLRGFDLFVTNALPKAATKAASWNMLAGTDAAVAAPMRAMRNYITEPQNASAERYEFRHTVTYGRQLINSKLLIRAKFNAADGT
ncbi:hypothetical protein [Candidatus Poriferisocius sp.]|uniref:hypothetical protein n=1 Tax=Candidatus Poriferisocius sp. TaxID=3101276 RepID=UPI003B52A2B9